MSSLPVPLHAVPTLTEVVQPEYLLSAATSSRPAALQADFSETIMAAPLALPASQEELLAQRVLQRIELVLEQRLQQVVDQLILEHTQALAPRLRQEVGLVVRESLTQVFAQAQEAPSSPRWP